MANSAIVGLLRALLVADTAEFDRAMQRSGDAAKTWSKEFKKIGREMTAVGETLTKTVTLPLVALGAASAKLAIDFESSFAGVRKTVDASKDEFAALEKEFRQLARTIPINVNEINKLGEAAGALGIPKKEIAKFVEVMAGLGVATNLTAEQAADSIARIQNIYGAAGKDTDRFASTLVALGNAGASTEKDIVTMATRIAGAGKTIGVTQAQTLAFASTLASVGIEAEAGGSAISRIFLKVNDAVSKGGPELDKFARAAKMSAADFKTAFETDAAGAVATLIAEIGKLGKNANPVIEGLVGKNIILKNAILAVGGAGDLLKDQLALSAKAWQDNSALTKETGERYKTVASQLTILWNKIQDVGITLGQALLPVIRKAIDLFGALVPMLEGAVKFFAALPEPIQIGAVAVLGLAAAAGPLLLLFGQLAFAASTLTGAFAAQGIATRGLAVAQTALGISSTALKAALPLLGTALFGVGAALAYAFSETSRLRKEQGEWAAEMAERAQLQKAAAKVFGEVAASQIDFAKMTREQRDELLQAGAAIKGTTVTLGGLNDQFGLVVTKGGEAKATVGGIPPVLNETDKAAERARKELEKLADTLTGADVAEKVAKLAAALALAQQRGAKVNFSKVRDEINDLEKAGGKILPTLERFRHQFDVTFGPDTGPSLFETWGRNLGSFRIEIDALGAELLDLSALHGQLRQDALSSWERDVGGGITFVPEAFSNWRQFDVFGNIRREQEEINFAHAQKRAADSLAVAKAWADEFGAMIGGVWNEIGAGLTDMFQHGISGAQSFSDGFVNIWKGIERKLADIFGQILNLFINGLIRGMVGYVTGNQAAFSQAFAGLGGTGANSLWRTVLGTGAGVGTGAAASGAVPGLALSTVNTSAVTGGTAASGAGMIGPVAGSVAGAGAGAAVGYFVGYRSGSRAKGIAAGAGTGATVGFALGGPIGAGVGGGVGALAGWYGAVKAGKEINNLRDAFTAAQGGAEALEGRLRDLGREDLWEPFAFGPRNLGAFKEALGNIQEVLEIAGARDAFAETRGGLDALKGQLEDLGRADLWAAINDASDPREMRQAVADVQAVMAATDEVMRKVATSFGKLQTAAAAYGRTLPASVRASIAPLLESRGLTDEMRAGLEALAKDPSWREIEDRAKDLGIDLAALGTQFQKSKIHETALGYVRDLTMFSDAGAEMDGVLRGMADELSDLYNDAKRHGIALPETLRPYMQRLVDLGLLIDDDGQKIIDLNGITFDPTIEDQPLIDIKNVLLEIKDLLERQLPEAANTAADEINLAFGRIRPPNIPPIGNAIPRNPPGPAGPPEPEPPTGGGAVPRPQLGLWGGTHGQYVDWGEGTAVTLHGRERVMTAGEALGGGSTTPIQITVVSTLDGREVARNQIKYIPRELALAGV